MKSILLLVTCALASLGATDTGLLGLVPADAFAVGGIDVSQARTTPLGAFVANSPTWSSSDFEKVVSQTNFDPRRDLQSVLFFHRGPNGGGVLARGTFDKAKIAALAQQNGFTPSDSGGTTLYVQKGTGTQHGFAFLDVDVAAMADLPSLQQIVANHAVPSQLNGDLQKLIADASTKGEFWLAALRKGEVAVTPAVARTTPAAQNGQNAPVPHQDFAFAGKAFEKVSSISAGMRSSDSVQLVVDATAITDPDATALADVVRFLKSSALAQQDPHAATFKPFFESLQATAQGSNVHLTASIPEALAEQIAAMHHPVGIAVQ